MRVLKSILLILAAVGWFTSVVGAVLQHRGSAKLSVEGGNLAISTSESHSRWGLTLVILGSSAGAAGTIFAVLASD